MPDRGNIKRPWTSYVLVLALTTTIALPAQIATAAGVETQLPPAVVWRDPGNVASLDLVYGAGGKEHAPNPQGKFTFVKEDMDGTSPKFDIKDEQGVEWKVKLGAEPKSETAATRLLWAAGYFVDEDYYLDSFKVEGLTKLHRGENFISPDGTVHGARLKRKAMKTGDLGNWSWFENTCGPTRPSSALRVMMALINNWDLKDINNALVQINGEWRCVVSDLGATFGNTGNVISRSKSDVKDYVQSEFIEKVNPDTVDFVMHSRPIIFAVVDINNYRARSRMEKITKDIPRADARWLGRRLALLSDAQLRDAFRAAGYTPEEIDEYATAVHRRIAQLNSL